MKSKFYRVTCKCGHVGKHFFIRIDFPISADSGKEAAEIARNIPRVKHNHKDAILNCTEIDFEEYQIIRKINNNDPYLRCENPQDQKNILKFEDRLEPEPSYLKIVEKSRRNVVEFKNRKRNNAERSFVQYQMDYENWVSSDELYAC